MILALKQKQLKQQSRSSAGIKGTDYNIHMEEDGLLAAGNGLWQLTWMDVRFGDILPTPRHGKPVEINAYWYNAVCIVRELLKSRVKKKRQRA